MLRIRRLKISLRMTARCNAMKSNVNASAMISSGVSNDGSMVDPPMRKTEAGWCSVFHQSTENLIIGRLTAPTSDRIAAARAPRPDLSPDPDLPADTRLWAALQQAAGGTWGGCVYDVDAIVAALKR